MIQVKDCVAIFAARMAGKSYEEICYEKKLSHKTVYNILHGQSRNARIAMEILQMEVK